MRRRRTASTRRRGRSSTAAWSRRSSTRPWAAPAGRWWPRTRTSSPPTSAPSSAARRDRGRSLPPPEPPLEARLHLRPVVVDHRVPRRVAPLAAADEHVLAEDPLEPRRERGEGGPRPLVRRVGLELDPEVALLLERVPQEEVLRLGVRARSPRPWVEPRVPDLDDAVLRPVVEEARVPDERSVEVVGEAELDAVEPGVEALPALVPAHAHQPPDARILRHRPERLLVPRLERLESHARPRQRYVKRHPSPSAKARRMRRATTALCTSSGPS